MKTRPMATRIPMQVRIAPTFNTQPEPRETGHKVACWSCAVIEAAWIGWIGALAWLVARMV